MNVVNVNEVVVYVTSKIYSVDSPFGSDCDITLRTKDFQSKTVSLKRRSHMIQ